MRMSPLRIAGWLVTAATVAVYLVMLTVTLPHLADLAGGTPVFDLMPGGYDRATAAGIVAALGAEGIDYYRTVQHQWDTAFPILLGLTLNYWTTVAAFRWRLRGLPLPSWVLALLIVVIGVEIACDLGENGAVASILATAPEALTDAQVGLASALTVAKSILSTIAYTALLVLALGPTVAGLFRRPAR